MVVSSINGNIPMICTVGGRRNNFGNMIKNDNIYKVFDK